MWSKLSMADKAKYINLAVQSGITDIGHIRDTYNSYARGGYTKWKDQILLHKGIDIDRDDTYDYERFFKEEPAMAWDMLNRDSDAHFIDKYKYSNHPSFSDESMYSGYVNDHNPSGIKGGHWYNNNTYVMSEDQFNSGWDTDKTLDYFRLVAEEEKITPPTLYDSNGAEVLRSVTVTPGPKDASFLDYLKYPIFNAFTANIANSNKPELLDMLSTPIYRVRSGKHYNRILGNEFIENNDNTIRPALFFANTQDTLLGDRKIPLSAISLYTGIENNKLKVAPLSMFREDTEVIPNRAKNRGKIKEIIFSEPTKELITEEGRKYITDIYPHKSLFFGLFPYGPAYNLLRTKLSNDLLMDRLFTETVKMPMTPRAVTESNDTIDINRSGAKAKLIFSDENGNSIFVNNLYDYSKPLRDKLNNLLKANPRYIYLPDNGRYRHTIKNGSTMQYVYPLDDPDKMFIFGYSSGGFLNKFAQGGDKSLYEEDWSDKIEPYTSAIALGADAIGLGTAVTGIGVPVGAAIASIGNIPNLVVDGYLTIRDWNRTINDDAPISDALWNTGELGLDLLGAKYAMKGVKFMNDRAFTNEVKGLIKDEVRRREGKKFLLRKKGMTEEEIAKYLTIKATNVVNNSKHVNDLRKKTKAKTEKQGRITKHLVGMPMNVYHASDLIAPSDNTRVATYSIPERLNKK